MGERRGGGTGPEGPRDEADPAAASEPMTAAQRSYLKALADELDVEFQGDLTREEATVRIQELQDEVERLRGERKKG